MISRYLISAHYVLSKVFNELFHLKSGSVDLQSQFAILSSKEFTGGHRMDLHTSDLPGPEGLTKKVRTAQKKGIEWTSLVRASNMGRYTCTLVVGGKPTTWRYAEYEKEWEYIGKKLSEREFAFAKKCLPEVFGEK